MSKDQLKAEVEEIERKIDIELGKPQEISVSDLDSSYIGKEVILVGRLAGELTQLAIAKIVVCQKCNEQIEVEPYIAIFDKHVIHRCTDGKVKKISLTRENVLEYQDFSILFIQNLLEQIKGFDRRFYIPKKVYVVGSKVPSTKKIKVRGKVIVSPNKEVCILASEVKALETEVETFSITEEDKRNWVRYFQNCNIKNLLAQIAPDMVGRPLVQESRLLVLHSPAEIPDINGKKIRGFLREILYGDTKTNKSESAKDVTLSHYHFGDYVVAESSSRAGITYTIDTDKKAIIWGVLVLNDLGYIAIDGLQDLYSEEMSELREALESGRVIVRRSQAGDALARTRVTGILNPNKPLNQYLFPCLALKDTYIFRNEPDLTRWDIFLPFATEDVDKGLIASRKIAERPIPGDVFLRHVYWVWSRKPEQIKYTGEAKEAIINTSKQIMEEFSIASLPIIHLGFRDTLTRISVAYAGLCHSVNETHEQIIVSETHVKKAAEFIKKMLETLQLKEYKLAEEGKLEITENEFKEIIQALDEIDYKIIESIKLEPKTSSILAEELDAGVRTIKEHYSKLANFGLILAKSGVGVSLTPRGIKFLHLLAGIGAKVQKNCTNSKKVQNFCTNAPVLEESRLNFAFIEPYFGTCSYCGKKTELRWRDENGNHVCDECK